MILTITSEDLWNFLHICLMTSIAILMIPDLKVRISINLVVLILLDAMVYGLVRTFPYETLLVTITLVIVTIILYISQRDLKILDCIKERVRYSTALGDYYSLKSVITLKWID